MVWVATGERGLTVMNNEDHDPDLTGAFIAQKAGAKVAHIPIESDRENRCSIFVMHPSVNDKVLGYFDQAIKLTKGWIVPGQTKLYENPQEKMHGRA